MEIERSRSSRRSVIAALAVLTGACGGLPDQDEGPPPGAGGEEVETTQAAVTAAFGGVVTDVEKMRFDLYPCPSPAQPDVDGDGVPDGVAASKHMISPLGAGALPQGLPAFENNPLDARSAHRYSDALFVVPALTCHVVRSSPLKADESPSKDCYPAAKTIGPVPAGKTKEVVIINQCKGAEKAVVDAVAALNHPPELLKIWFERDGKPALKFTQSCETLRVCAAVLDPDNDPIEWNLFEVDAAGKPVLPPKLAFKPAPGYPVDNGQGVSKNCWDLPRSKKGDYHVQLLARDQVWDRVSNPGAPTLIPVEKFIAAFQHESYRSRAEQQFPLHVVKCERDCEQGVHLVFAIDTSGSMVDESAQLCAAISSLTFPFPTKIDVYGLIGGASPPGFPCVTDSVANKLGASVPGDDGACGGTLNQSESWGQATAILAERHAWQPGYVKVIAPLSDEATCDGNPCNDPGQDRDAIDNAAYVAVNRPDPVIVSPIIATPAGSFPPTDVACVDGLAQSIAGSTGGKVFNSNATATDLPAHIKSLVAAACGEEP